MYNITQLGSHYAVYSEHMESMYCTLYKVSMYDLNTLYNCTLHLVTVVKYIAHTAQNNWFNFSNASKEFLSLDVLSIQQYGHHIILSTNDMIRLLQLDCLVIEYIVCYIWAVQN